MLPLYNECKEERGKSSVVLYEGSRFNILLGKGMFIRMKAKMAEHIKQKSEIMFKQSRSIVKCGLNRLMQEMEQRLANICQAKHRAIGDLIKSVLAKDQAKDQPLVEAARIGLQQAVLEECKKLDKDWVTITKDIATQLAMSAEEESEESKIAIDASQDDPTAMDLDDDADAEAKEGLICVVSDDEEKDGHFGAASEDDSDDDED